MKTQQIYIRFLNLLQTIEGTGELPNIDPDARRLLEAIAVRSAQGQPLTVTEAMTLQHIASPATIHRKLDVLRESGMIETQFEGANRRTKYLIPTADAQTYFETVGRAMQRALKTA